jgi:hypothetical protein
MDGHDDSPLLGRVVAELPEIFRHEILPLLVGTRIMLEFTAS